MSPEFAAALGVASTAFVGAIGKVLITIYQKKVESEVTRIRIEREDTQRHKKLSLEEQELKQRAEIFFAEQSAALMKRITEEHERERETWHAERAELVKQVAELETRIKAYDWLPDLLNRIWIAISALNHDGPATSQELRDLHYVVGEARLRLHAHANLHRQQEPA